MHPPCLFAFANATWRCCAVYESSMLQKNPPQSSDALVLHAESNPDLSDDGQNVNDVCDFAKNKATNDDDGADDDTKPSFASLNLAKPIVSALKSLGYTHATPIQQQAIPCALLGQDLLLSAQTGSGKTAAFVLPILHKLFLRQASEDRHASAILQAVILTPTRELAMQVQDSVRKYSSHMRRVFSTSLVGGTSYVGQIKMLKKGVHIVVATPGRFLDHLNSGRLDLSSVDTLVLDEADRMLDMGFSEDIESIITRMPSVRQTVMSSATWDGNIGKIAQKYTKDAQKIAIAQESAHIEERVYLCDDFTHKNAILVDILQKDNIDQAVIFAATKQSTEKLTKRLVDLGYHARYLHGDLPQGKRNRIVSDIKSKKCQFLVATDVAARGIDIKGISHVINYDLPMKAEDYVHRIGRSGRAGRTGVAMNLCSMEDKKLLLALMRYIDRDIAIASRDGLPALQNTSIAPERNKNKRRPQKRRREQFEQKAQKAPRFQHASERIKAHPKLKQGSKKHDAYARDGGTHNDRMRDNYVNHNHTDSRMHHKSTYDDAYYSASNKRFNADESTTHHRPKKAHHTKRFVHSNTSNHNEDSGKNRRADPAKKGAHSHKVASKYKGVKQDSSTWSKYAPKKTYAKSAHAKHDFHSQNLSTKKRFGDK